VQRVFYFHVPIAWVGYLSFFLVLLGSVGHLWKGGKKWDNFAYSSAEIGLVFTSLILITGMIWAKPVWGVWWTWDPRLTISLIMWFIYVAYFMIRTYAPNISQAARYSAVLGIFGFISVPINYFSIVWWRTVHPQPVTGPAAESGSLEGTMQMALMFSLVTFTVLFWYLLRERLKLCRYEDSVEQTRKELQDLNSIPGR
jgi:heme exporter protein C